MTDLEKLSARAAPYKYKDIAAVCKMHPRTVGRIIRRQQSTTTATIAKLNAAIDILEGK